MRLFTRRRGGTALQTNKHDTVDRPIEEAIIPRYLYYPLSMHIGKPAEVQVEVGDSVKIGTVLAQADGAVSANVISTVSGKVIAIEEGLTADGPGDMIIVENDFQEEREAPLYDTSIREELSSEDMIQLIRDAGIAGMGGATFPTDIKLSPKAQIDYLLVNGAECEPFSTADYRLMVEESEAIAKGIELLHDLFPHSLTRVGIEYQNEPAIEAMQAAVRDLDYTEVTILDNLYPQGSEKNLIQNITGREVPPGAIPADVGCIVINIGTVFAIQECLLKGKPLIDRVTTVSGAPLKTPKNFRVRIGTPINELLKACGGFAFGPGRVLHGGPMMGKVIASGQVPVTKGTSVISVLTEAQAIKAPRYDCIRCSECLNVCPVNLQPILISIAYERGDIEKAKELGAMDCIECGNCSYICPSNIPLLENIRAAKEAIQAQSS